MRPLRSWASWKLLHMRTLLTVAPSESLSFFPWCFQPRGDSASKARMVESLKSFISVRVLAGQLGVTWRVAGIRLRIDVDLS